MSTPSRALALAACLALAGCGGGGKKEGSVKRSEFFGMNAQYVLDGPEDSWDQHLAVMEHEGIGVVRYDALWDTAEPVAPVGGRHTYEWGMFDAVAEHLARHHLRWLPVIGYSAPWAGEPPGERFAPPRDADFTAYAAAFATRYGPDGSFWRAHADLPRLPVDLVEIWNEPDTARFWSSRDPVRFASLLSLSAEAVKAAAPGVKVMLGGLTPGGLGFLRAMYAARPDLAHEVDAVGSHPYAADARGVVDNVAALRDTLRSLGQGRTPIYVTELGWPTRGDTGFVTADTTRGALLVDSARRLRASGCGVAGFFPYTWLTLERAPDDAEEYYGLYDVKVKASQAGQAYAEAIRRGGGSDAKGCAP
jgi:hypothetical protein